MSDFAIFAGCGCCGVFVLFLIIMVFTGIRTLNQSEWALKYNWWSESVHPEPILTPGLMWVGMGNYLIKFPNTNRHLYFRKMDISHNPDDIYMDAIEVRTADGLKAQLECEFVYRLQPNSLLDLYMMVGDNDHGGADYHQLLAYIASGVLSTASTTFTAQDFYTEQGKVADMLTSELTKALNDTLSILLTQFQLQPAHFPQPFIDEILRTQEMKTDISVAQQENQTKAITKQTELNNAHQMAQQTVLQAEAQAEQTRLQTEAEVAQFSYRQKALAEGYAQALNFFGTGAKGTEAMTHFQSFLKIEALKVHDAGKVAVKLSSVSDPKPLNP